MQIENLKIDAIKSNRTVQDYSIIEVIGINDKTGEKYKGSIAEVVLSMKASSNNPKKIFVPSAIFYVASGHRQKYEGCKWNFAKDEDIQKYNIFSSESAREKLKQMIKTNDKAIVAFDTAGNPVKGFESVVDALIWIKSEKNIILDYKSILFIAKNHSKKTIAKTAGTFQWRFYDELV